MRQSQYCKPNDSQLMLCDERLSRPSAAPLISIGSPFAGRSVMRCSGPALIGRELENLEQTGPEEHDVAVNDNGLSWPFIAFPEGWCSSS